MDPRNKTLAKNLVEYSVGVKKGERVYINAIGVECLPLIKAIIREVYKVGAYPYVNIDEPMVEREVMMGCSKEQLEPMSELKLKEMELMDCYISVRCPQNICETSDVPDEKRITYAKINRKAHTQRVDHTRWVVLRYPNSAMAQSASTSTEAFENHYYNVCNLDYSVMSKAMDALVNLMEKTDKVHIVGKGTDLSFSIKGIPTIKCDGHMNIPDGEVYTAPVKDSVNGVISYNTSSLYQGVSFENVTLHFKDGKIIKAECNNNSAINNIFDSDEGARYVGEFAIGVNPYITEAIKDTLFDEKIAGSFHFTPGNSYEDAPNGNKSSVHWDLVCIQTPEYGGGEMYFDDILIRKDGKFVIDELLPLNPENLK